MINTVLITYQKKNNLIFNPIYNSISFYLQLKVVLPCREKGPSKNLSHLHFKRENSEKSVFRASKNSNPNTTGLVLTVYLTQFHKA